MHPDGAGTHIGESYIAVTEHWIDRIQTPTQSLGKCTWKLVSAVLAVSIDNSNPHTHKHTIYLCCFYIISYINPIVESHTADNIVQLLKDCTQSRYQMGTRMDSITTDIGAHFKAAVQIILNEDITEESSLCLPHIYEKFYRPMQKEGVLVLINVTYNYTLSSCRSLIMTLEILYRCSMIKHAQLEIVLSGWSTWKDCRQNKLSKTGRQWSLSVMVTVHVYRMVSFNITF